MMLPGDDGFPGQSIAEIISHAGEADIIIPIVTNPGARSRFRAFASKGFTTLLNWTFWLNVGYYNGAVLQRNDLLRAIEIRTNSFAYQAEALVKLIARGATYTHCHVRIQDRAAGRSSALRLKNQMAVGKTILHLLAEVGLFRRVPLAPRGSCAERKADQAIPQALRCHAPLHAASCEASSNPGTAVLTAMLRMRGR